MEVQASVQQLRDLLALAKWGNPAHQLAMNIGLIGCGKMGAALAKGLVASGVVRGGDLALYDVYPGASHALAEETGGRATGDAIAAAEGADAVLLCTKPADLQGLLVSLRVAGAETLFVSIAAGVTLSSLEEGLGPASRVVRAMPNTPALVGKGASAFARGTRAVDGDAALAARLLGAVGSVTEVPENLMDAVTGLSGSGPAFVYTVIEALADGGVYSGLPRNHFPWGQSALFHISKAASRITSQVFPARRRWFLAWLGCGIRHQGTRRRFCGPA